MVVEKSGPGAECSLKSNEHLHWQQRVAGVH